MSRRVTIDYRQLKLLMVGFFIAGLVWGTALGIMLLYLIYR